MTIPDKLTATFLPDNVTVDVKKGENLLRSANAAGVHINASCGGDGLCGKCRIRIKSGEVTSKKTEKLTDKEIQDGYRLACISTIETPLEVEIPAESRLDRGLLDQQNRTPTGRLVTPLHRENLIKGWFFNPTIVKSYIEIDPPTIEDNTSDLSRTLRALKKQYNLDNISVDYNVIKKLPVVLREGKWKATVTIVHTRVENQLDENQMRGSRKPKLMNIEKGDTTGQHYILAFDIGTTTICGQLLDMEKRDAIAEISDYNGQIKYGEDVIARIVFSLKGDGLSVLQNAAVDTINGIIDDLISKSGIERSQIAHITVAGNTTMTHILFNLDPKYIREAPYTPIANNIPPVRAKNLGIHLDDHAYCYAFPLVSSYIGGDIVSGVLASGLYQRDKNTLFIDIGTNGEIVVGNAHWLLSASCSAGPAFEGGGIKHGMRATFGAIEEIRIDPETCEPITITIGDEKPKGICGSGIINIVAELMESGILDPNGKFNTDIKTERLRRGNDGNEYILAWATESSIERDIVLTEVDIDNFMRAKGAMYAGYQTLLESVGLTFNDLDEIIIAGAFGSYIDIEKSIVIGLLPDIPIEKFNFIGNSSLLGAKMITFSNELLDDAERIAKKMTNFELSDNNRFMDNYIAAQFFPHTQLKQFPHVMKKFENLEKRCKLCQKK